MVVRIGTFNIENLLTRFDFAGFRNQLRGDRVLRLYQSRPRPIISGWRRRG